MKTNGPGHDGGCYVTNLSVAADFATHDALPRRLREWFYSCRLVWAAQDALKAGWTEQQILAYLNREERLAVLDDRPIIWGDNYPADALETNQERNPHAKQTHPVPRLRRSAPLLRHEVARRRPRRGPTDRWGPSGS